MAEPAQTAGLWVLLAQVEAVATAIGEQLEGVFLAIPADETEAQRAQRQADIERLEQASLMAGACAVLADLAQQRASALEAQLLRG